MREWVREWVRGCVCMEERPPWLSFFKRTDSQSCGLFFTHCWSGLCSAPKDQRAQGPTGFAPFWVTSPLLGAAQSPSKLLLKCLKSEVRRMHLCWDSSSARGSQNWDSFIRRIRFESEICPLPFFIGILVCACRVTKSLLGFGIGTKGNPWLLDHACLTLGDPPQNKRKEKGDFLLVSIYHCKHGVPLKRHTGAFQCMKRNTG